MNSWCVGCIWGKDTGIGTYCPLVVGSCIKVPETICKPDPERVHKAITTHLQYEAGRIKESKK